VLLATTTDRYAGWIGQIYSKGRYEQRISRRTHRVGGEKYVEEILPIDSVAEYFKHFPVLEIDYTFTGCSRKKTELLPRTIMY